MTTPPSRWPRWPSAFRRGGDLMTTLIGVIAQAYVLVVGLGVLVLTAKALGPEGRGVIATVTTLLVSLTTLVSLSLGQVVTRVAAGQDPPTWLPRALGSLLAFTAAATLAGWIGVAVALASGFNVARDIPVPLLALALAALPFSLWEQYSTQLLLLLRKAEACSIILFVGRSIYLLLIVAALGLGVDLAGVIVAGLCAQAAIALAQGWLLWRASHGALTWDPALLWRLMRDGFKVHWNFVGDLLLVSASVLSVTAALGVREAGLYQAALSLLTVPNVIPQAASMVLVGHIGTFGAHAAWVEQRRLVFGILAGMGGLAIVCAMLGPIAIPFVLGSDFRESVGLFQLLCPLLVSNSLIRLMAAQWLARGLFAQASTVTLAAGGTNVFCTWLLVPRFGTWGAAVGLMTAHVVLVAAQVWMIVRCERERPVPAVVVEPLATGDTVPTKQSH